MTTPYDHLPWSWTTPRTTAISGQPDVVRAAALL